MKFKMGSVLVGIIALMMLLGAFSTPMSDGIKTWRTTAESEGFSVTTGAGVTTANVTLTADLYQEAPGEATFTSNVTAEQANIFGSTYTDAAGEGTGGVLLVAGLDASTTRSLTVAYNAETDDPVLRALGPFLAVLIIGGCVLGIFWGMAHGR